MSLRIKFLEFKKKVVAIFLVIILKLAIVLEDIRTLSSHFRNGRIGNWYFWLKKPDQSGYEGTDLPEGTQIFINQSLCPYYKSLWSKSKKLCSLEKIYSFFILNSTIKIKLQENRNAKSIAESSHFDKFFPDVHLPLSN